MKILNEKIKIALLWEHCGPYHWARAKALKILHDNVELIELSDINITYSWRRDPNLQLENTVLFTGKVAESISAVDVFFHMRKWLSINKIDVLFVPSYWPPTSLASAIAAKSLGCRVVFMGDSHYSSGRNKGFPLIVKKFLIKFYDSALVAGTLHRSFMKLLGVSDEKIFDGYDTVDNEYFSLIANRTRNNKSQVRAELNLPENFFLSLGRFIPKKNLASIINSFSKLVHHNENNVHDLVFVGSGILQKSLINLATENKLPVFVHSETSSTTFPISKGGQVHFYPFNQIDTVPKFYALATTLIIASSQEEWGLVVNEAMASMCPVIASRSVGSSPDLVIDGKTGYQFNPESSDELAYYMKLLCNDLNHARELGKQARAHINNWSTTRFANNALDATVAAFKKYP